MEDEFKKALKSRYSVCSTSGADRQLKGLHVAARTAILMDEV